MDNLSAWIATLPEPWVSGLGPEVFTFAHQSYQSPGRFYHSWDHALACVEALRTIPCESGQVTFLALLFHDAVYVAGRKDNESLSADLAVAILRQHSKLGEAALSEIHAIILATRDHKAPSATSHDLKAALDIDMSILGSSPEDYARYASAVRQEWCPSVTSDQKFTAGRITFLKGVLAEPRIFNLPEAVERWEAAARSNLLREVGELEARQSWIWRTITKLYLGK